MNQQQSGFTLVEVAITLAVVGILSAVAWPNYQGYVQKAYRVDAKTVMLNLAQLQERYYTNNGAYFAYQAAPDSAPPGWPAYSGGSIASPKYSIGVSAGSMANTGAPLTDAYTITATPMKPDAKCGILKLDSTGAKTASGSAGTSYCWN